MEKVDGPEKVLLLLVECAKSSLPQFPSDPLQLVILPIFFFLVATVLHRFVCAFSSCTEQGLIFTAVHGLLIVVASAAVEHKL